MRRREFLASGSVAGVASLFSAQTTNAQSGLAVVTETRGMPKLVPPETPARLNLCLQWHAIPGGEFKEKLDFMEKHGFAAVEIPSGEWLLKNGETLKKEMEGRKLFVATACGGSDFSSADPAKREEQVQKMMPQIEILGMLKSPGMIVCPARRKVEMGFAELREDFVNNTGKRLAQHAAKMGTSIVLEPLQRAETPFLRQVADGARMAHDIGPGATVMGDFWHMSKEETSFMGAFICAGKLLSHVHVASLKDRKIPGMEPEYDQYVDGFKGLKLIGYQGAVSLEGGFPKDPANPKKEVSAEEKTKLILNMVALLKDQWAIA